VMMECKVDAFLIVVGSEMDLHAQEVVQVVPQYVVLFAEMVLFYGTRIVMMGGKEDALQIV